MTEEAAQGADGSRRATSKVVINRLRAFLADRAEILDALDDEADHGRAN